MKKVEEKDIKEIIDWSEEGMGDTICFSLLPDRSDASPYDFFVEHFLPDNPDCDLVYDKSWDGEGDGMNGRGCDFAAQFGSHTDWGDVWNKFWSSFFNSGEDLNGEFWKAYEEWKEHNALREARRNL